MPALNTKAISLLSSTSVDMKTAASTTIYTVPAGRVLRIVKMVVRDATASLAGGTSYSVTGWRQTFSLANLITANTGYVVLDTVSEGTPTQYTEQAAGTAITLTVTTGSTLAATATIDLFAYLT